MHVAITGASSGIGRALAVEFAKLPGSRLTLVSRRKTELEELASTLSNDGARSRDSVSVVPHDLSLPGQQALTWVTGAEATLGPIDVLINCAGVMDVGATASFDLAIGERLMNVNLHAPVLLTQRVLPSMLERRSGVIINISSLAGLVPMPGALWYATAKAGLSSYSEGLRVELRGTGVHVLTVYPGPVDTPLAKASFDAYGDSGVARLLPRGDVEGLARRIARAVRARSARVIYPLPYWLTYWFPRFALAFTSWFTPRLPPGRTFSQPRVAGDAP